MSKLIVSKLEFHDGPGGKQILATIDSPVGCCEFTLKDGVKP